MTIVRSVLVGIGTVLVVAACGDSDSPPPDAEPPQPDPSLIESAEVTPEELEAIGAAPGKGFVVKAFSRECMLGSPSACRCAAQALSDAVSPAELVLLALRGSEGQRALRRVFGEAVSECSARAAPPSRLDTAAELPEGPVTVTPETVGAAIGGAFDDERARAAFVRNCATLDSPEACGCRYDELRKQLDLSELIVLTMNLPEALESEYFNEATAACEAA